MYTWLSKTVVYGVACRPKVKTPIAFDLRSDVRCRGRSVRSPVNFCGSIGAEFERIN